MAPPEPLVTMRAGKMTCQASRTTTGKFTITPLPEKGQIQVVKTNEGFTQFQWKNRIDDSVDPNCDHMVFPGDAKFEKVNTGREGDRVVMLQFSSNASRRFFFWLQHKKDDDDEELTKKVNDAINGVSSTEEAPSTEGENAASAANTGATPAAQPAVNMQQLLSALGLPEPAPAAATPASSSTGAGGGTPGAGLVPSTASGPAAGSGSPGAVTAADLMRALNNASAALPQRSPAVPLQEVVTAEQVDESGVLEDTTTQEQLLPTLPADHQTVEELRATVHSPQYQQTLASLTSALQSENYNSIFANFGLDPAAGAEALARGNGVEAFLAALEAQAGAGASGENAAAGGGDGGGDAAAAAAGSNSAEDSTTPEPLDKMEDDQSGK